MTTFRFFLSLALPFAVGCSTQASTHGGDMSLPDAGEQSTLWFGTTCTMAPCVLPDSWDPIASLPEAFARARAAVPGFESTVRFAHLDFGGPAPVAAGDAKVSSFTWSYVFDSGDGHNTATFHQTTVSPQLRNVDTLEGPAFGWVLLAEEGPELAGIQTAHDHFNAFANQADRFAIGGGDDGIGLDGKAPAMSLCLTSAATNDDGTPKSTMCFDDRSGARL